MLKLLDREPTQEMILAGEKELTRHDFLRMKDAFCAMYDAAPEVVQEPVAHVYRNEHGTVRIDKQYLPSADSFPVFAYPTDAQAEIAKRDVRIAELEQELQTTADALAEVEQIRLGLENVRLFAARHRKEDWALLILGFCSEAGVVGSALR